MPVQKKILCIGADPALLRTRCDILVAYGYDARYSLYFDAGRALGSDQFDLVVVSAFLTDQEKDHILALTGDATPTVILRGLTYAPELLQLVKQRLSP